MKIIADTNTFLATALNEPEKKAIISLTAGHELIAPEILYFEIGNALSAMIKRGRITWKEALGAYDMTQKIPVELRSIDIRKALKIANLQNIYAYDAYFLECSQAFNSPLLTLDIRLKKVATKLGIKLLEVES
ncbi:MAG: type II toxin-antitoxin system VapC family toxin [Desulfobulbales bacterium]|jgi:predicted nucleic acid-binding protein